MENLDEKYQIKSEIDHILDRPGTWIGSKNTVSTDYPLYVPSKNRIQLLANIGFNAGLLKLVDEVLSNSIDEHRRKDSLFHITEISVHVDIDGTVIISDNGGIPVQMHKGAGLYVPELIFGHLRTSSNYNDNQEREVVGTNGLGAKLTNIYSTEFQVKTSDGKKQFITTWSNNMKDKIDNKITPSTTHGTEIKFKIELERFEIDQFPASTIRIIQKRCIDACAANPGLKVNFSSDAYEGKLNSSWVLNSFEEYAKMYLDEKQFPMLISYHNKKDTVLILPENIGYNIGFVNGGACSFGTHIKKVEKQITDCIKEYCDKNDMELITEKDILNRISIFVNTTIINPEYESQTKEKLASKVDKYVLQFSQEFLKSLQGSEIIKALKDFYEVKYAEEKKKEIRNLNKNIKTTKIKKLIQCASNSPANNELWLFEGTSASNGFRKQRNLFQAAYLLRGKITNTFDLKRTQILENQELREVIAALGLLFDEPQKNIKNCMYSKIVIASDMDYDGHHICGLLISFFAQHFPELFRANKIYRALSPIVVADPYKKGKLKKKYYYDLESFEADKNNLKDYDIIYTKGLGGLDDDDYFQMLRNQKLIQFTFDNLADRESIQVWFAKSTEARKQIILDDEGEN